MARVAWRVRWAASAERDGLGAFEGVEDDRAGSHPEGAPHIRVDGDAYRFTVHLRDRDRAGDRQRQEVKGMRAAGVRLDVREGEVWRWGWQLLVPPSLLATTTFTHVFQVMRPGVGSSPLVVMSLRRRGGVERVELTAGRDRVGEVELGPLRGRWVDVEVGLVVGERGAVRWRVRDGERVVVDATRDDVVTWAGDRVRPKWGIYRSLGDTSGSLRDCHLLVRGLRADRWA